MDIYKIKEPNGRLIQNPSYYRASRIDNQLKKQNPTSILPPQFPTSSLFYRDKPLFFTQLKLPFSSKTLHNSSYVSNSKRGKFAIFYATSYFLLGINI
jgi:hypothetical protein